MHNNKLVTQNNVLQYFSFFIMFLLNCRLFLVSLVAGAQPRRLASVSNGSLFSSGSKSPGGGGRSFLSIVNMAPSSGSQSISSSFSSFIMCSRSRFCSLTKKSLTLRSASMTKTRKMMIPPRVTMIRSPNSLFEKF